MADETKTIDEGFLRKGAASITAAHVAKAVANAAVIEEKFVRSSAFDRVIADVMLLIAMVGDYYHGRYREVPWTTIAVVTFALLYVLNPLDLIPDVLPVVGYVDDAAVVALCLKAVRSEVRAYGEWKKQQPA